MKKIFSRLLLVGILFLTAQQMYAQSSYTLRAVLIDSLSREPIEFATVAVYEEGATTASKFAISDKKGAIEIRGIKPGDHEVRIDLMGYISQSRKLSFKGRNTVVDLGSVGMQENANQIDAVVVSAVGNPIIVKKDTIQYNASSFKTTDNDMLEELLKKLPGVEVDSEGKITANGKEISKIMIDGKMFFTNDPTIATKNLPAKMVEKVNVVNRKSDQARFTGIDDGDEETVLDLSVRPGMMNGWFGNVGAGYGTDDRYQANGMVGRFENATQIALIGNANNTNNRGFFDSMSSGMQGMRMGGGGGRGMGGGAMRIGGNTFNFGGNGITTSWNGGLNANGEFAKGKLKLGGSYFYGGSENKKESLSERQNFLPDSSYYVYSEGKSTTNTQSHSANLDLEYNPNEKNYIRFRPSASLGYGDFNEQTESTSKGSSGSLINDSWSKSFGNSNSVSTAGNLTMGHRFEKAGRTISLNINYNLSKTDLEGTNQSETRFYGETTGRDTVNQQYQTNSEAYSISGRLSYTEPLGKNYFIELAYRYRYNQNNSEKESYNYNPLTKQYDLKDLVYSNTFENKFVNQQAELNFRSNQEKYSYTIGMGVQPSYTHSIGDTTDLSRSVVNFAPRADFRYNFSDNTNLRIEYNGTTNQPSLSQLQPVPDNTNPLLISLGNPDLLPEFTNRLSIDFRNTKMSTFRMISVRADLRYTLDRIITKSWVEDGGVQFTQPVNEGTAFFGNLFVMFNSPIARSKFYIMSNGGLNTSDGASYSNGVKNHTTTLGLREMLRFSYRGEKLDIGISGSANYSLAWYTIDQKGNNNTWNNRITADLNWTLPLGFSLVSDINYNYYIGYPKGYNAPSTVWNASVSKLLFKNKATLTAKVYDILKDSKSINHTTNDSYIEDVQTNILGQYFMFSFTYRFGTFGNQRGGGRPGGGPPMRHGGGRPF